MNRSRFPNQTRQPPPQPQPTPRFPPQRFSAQFSGTATGSSDSGRGSLGAGINSQATLRIPQSNQNQQEQRPPVAESQVLDDFDFDWGDDDDDFDMVMASQAVEAATSGNPQSYGVSPSRRDMTLENIRLELAFKESNGEDVRSEDFMQDGVLGGNISHRNNPNMLKESERIAELERINKELTSENYSCKGEVTNLRRLLNKNSQERQRDLINRQARDEENRKKETETKQKEKQELESTKTSLRFTEKELRAQTERCEALKKQLQRLQAMQNAVQSSSPVKGGSLNQTMNSSRVMNTTSLSSLGFPSMSAFSARITPSAASAPQPQVVLPPSPKKQLIHAEVQTGAPSLDLEIAELEKECREAYELQQKLISDCIEQVSAATTRELRRMLPRIKEMAAGAENKLVKGLNLQGYRYEMFFPDNLKVAEFIMDDMAQKSRCDRMHLASTKVKIKFPSQLKDWEETIGFDEGLQALLFAQKDIWGALCFVLDDLHRRIEFMRRMGNRNSLYRTNNCVHFFKILVWGTNLWSNFFPMLWAANTDPRREFFQEIRKWSACILWVGNRNFEVEDVQVELRNLVLKSLTQVAHKGLLHYTAANYLRLFNVISNTLNTPAHSSLENVVDCLEVAQALNRKKFLMYICRKQNDGTCLARQFALHAIQFFEDEKSLNKRFRLYKAYVNFLVSIGEWCVVHSNGECGEAVQADDPDFFITSPVFNPPNSSASQASSRSGNNLQESVHQNLDISGAPQGNLFDATINSMYLSEDISVINLDSDEEELHAQKEPEFKKPKLHKTSKYRPEAPGTSKQLLEQCSMEVDDEESTKGSYEDEWDATQQEFLEINASQSERPPSPIREQEPCKKFLECSLWEEERGRDSSNTLCQCRFYLLEAFMRMTEEMVYIWRHLKILQGCQNLAARRAEEESREEKLEERIRELEEMKAKKLVRSGKPKSREEYEEEMSISRESSFWRRIINDSAFKEDPLTPEVVASYLEYAVEIMYDSFNSAQNSISRAFGKEGANSFHVSSAYLLRYAHDLGFSQELKSYLRQVTIIQAQVSLTSKVDDNLDTNEDSSDQMSTGSQLFEDGFQIKTIPKFDPNNPDIVAALPPSLVETLMELERQKEETRRSSSEARCATEDDDTDYEDEANSHIQQKFKKIEIGSASETESEPEVEEGNSDDNYATTDNSYDEDPSKEEGECDEEDKPFPKKPKRYRKVRDYTKFCAPTLQHADGYYDSDEELDEVKVSFKELQEAFSGKRDKEQNPGAGTEKGLYIGYKTAKQVCEELEANVSDDVLFEKPLENLDGGRINLEDQELNDFMKDLSSGLNIQGYYENKTLVWDDYTKKGVPFKI
ncbi:unnamed protein product [Allacma fusca]|uniref:Uncharacterized protein n=1 Tax=Allacma fusca TaxID=39272 RepID=A0A8J2P146_9HEXA|nr:unnamed protein product [Allacma fusca]